MQSFLSLDNTIVILAIVLFTCLLLTIKVLVQSKRLATAKAHADVLQGSIKLYSEKAFLLDEKQRQLDAVSAANMALEADKNALQQLYTKTLAQSEAQKARIDALLENHEDKLATMAASEKRLHTQFENLANKIFEEKQSTYTSHAKTNIESVLAPFKHQLESFKKQVTCPKMPGSTPAWGSSLGRCHPAREARPSCPRSRDRTSFKARWAAGVSRSPAARASR